MANSCGAGELCSTSDTLEKLSILEKSLTVYAADQTGRRSAYLSFIHFDHSISFSDISGTQFRVDIEDTHGVVFRHLDPDSGLLMLYLRPTKPYCVARISMDVWQKILASLSDWPHQDQLRTVSDFSDGNG